MLRANSSLTVTAAVLLAILIAGIALIPNTQASAGNWRNVNPTEYTNVPDARLNSVYMLSGGTGGINSGMGWAVGNNGTIFQWDGFSWKNYSSGTPCNLNSVNFGSPLSLPMSSISSSAGFIVGGNVSQSTCPKAIALFWNGASWFPANIGLDVGQAENLTSVFVDCAYGSNSACGSSQVDAFAVGLNATAGTSYRFTGTPPGSGWTQVPVPGSTNCQINSVYMVSPNEGWAVGKCGKIYHYFGGGWTNPYTFSTPSVDFKSVFMVSSTEGWAVGTGGQVSHYFSGSWQSPYSPSGTTTTLRSVSCVGSSECWAVGDSATIVHYISGTWTPLNVIQVPTIRGLMGVHGTGGSNVWAVGETGSILMYDGSVWGSITSPLQTDFNSVYMTGSSDGAAVGNRTVINGVPTATIARWDGVKWVRPQGTAAPTDLWGVWEASSSEWWAVGGGESNFPYILHLTSMTSTSFAGTDFTSIGCGANCIFLSVFGTSSSNVWAVGTNGVFALWTGGPNWGVISTTAGTVWRSVTFVGGDSTKGFAAGFSGAGPLLDCYVNGCSMLGGAAPAGWGTASLPGGLPANTQLNSVSTEADNTNRVWIAGSNGRILMIDGNTKTITPTSTSSNYNLTSIFVDSSSDGWAVGQDLSNYYPIFLHYDGTGWNPVSISPPPPLATESEGRIQSMFLLSSTNGFAVGTAQGVSSITSNRIASLGMMFHLDPPGGVYATASTSSTPTPTSTSVASSVTSIVSTSSATSAGSVTSSTSSMPVTSTTSSSQTSGVSSATTAAISTPTTATSTSNSISVSTPMTLPPIPGFPWESIIAGIIIGMAALAILRRRRK
ncbi:MAG: hypothetical protein WB661_02980 [Candidatus Bathyarchaeia archaeon]